MSKVITTATHGKGSTYLTFSKDGQRAFTGGQDCIVRIWRVNEGAEQEPSTAAEAEDAITCLATADDYWFSGSEDTEVRRYLRDSNEFDAPLTSVAGVPVRDIAVDPKGRRVAVTSDELFVRIVDMEDTSKSTRLEGYTSGVRSATWHPSGSLLATCTCDGKIIIWNLSSEQPIIEKTIEGIIPKVIDTESSEFSHDCSLVWHTSGQYFFVATKGHEIITISRSDWSKTATLSDKSASGPITALALSPNGVYLASASQSRVHIWSTQTKRIVVSQTGNPGSTITRIRFSPRENLIAWTDTDGVFSRWSKAIDDKFPDPIKASIGTSSGASIPVKLSAGLDLFATDDSKGGTGDDAGGVDLDDDMADIDDGWIVDDMDGALQAEVPENKRDPFVKEMVSITKAQPPFQPGATPFSNKKRYLAHNLIGVIEVSDLESHQVVNVELFDKSLRKGFHFKDTWKHDLGYLGERGAVFACPPGATSERPATIHYRPFTSATTSWDYELSRQGTKCLGIAAGGAPITSKNARDVELEGYGFVVIATTDHDLTFLSGSGRELRIMALPGDFVSMVASHEWVFVVHRAGSTTIDGSQNLHYTIVNIADFSIRQRDILPLPKGHTLKWIGLTDIGAPAMYDSVGYVHILTKHRIPHHATWARVLDTNLLERRKGKDESYWPVGIAGENFMCLILKGRQEFPSFPRPLIQELPLQIPFRNSSTREEWVVREALQIDMMFDDLDEELTTDEIVSREKLMDAEFIKLVQTACRNNDVARAVEITKLIHHTAVFDLVMQVADFYKLPGLKEKMAAVKQDREEAEDRLILARSKRRRWLKPEPPLRQLAGPSNSNARFDPLADTRPPPAIERPGMARVTVPIIAKARSTSVALQSQTQDRSTWDDASSPPSESKRKRAEIEESFPSSDISMPPPKQKSNPFARKSNQDGNKNPFARKSEAKTIQKSESFFDKVDAAESETAPKKSRPSLGRGKEKKEGDPKQATLFGMMSKAAPRQKKLETPAPEAPEDSQETQIDSQMTDVVSDADMVTFNDVETQEVSQQHRFSPDWDETQLEDDSPSMEV